jgi:imidazolonepropionase
MIPAMADLLVVNARIATMRGGRYAVIEKAGLHARDGRIAWIGTMKDLDPKVRRGGAERLDARGALLTPGLIDCHTHLVYAGNRANEFEMRSRGMSYADIARAGGGILSTVKATREATNAELRAVSAARLKALMSEGVTTVEIKSGYGLDVDNELRCLRIARSLAADHAVSIATTLLAAHAVPPEFKGRADEYVEQVCERMIPRAASEGLASAVDGFCETIAFTREQVRRVFEAAQLHGLRVKLHADQLSDAGGAELAAQFGALSADHLEYASEAGVAALAKAGCVAVVLPGAFYFLRETRAPPIELLRKHGVPMAVATDCNPGTSPTTSILTTMNMACTLFGLTPEEALAGATCHAASALGLDDRGSLEQGSRADFAVWDADEPVQLAAQIAGQKPRCVAFEGRVRE